MNIFLDIIKTISIITIESKQNSKKMDKNKIEIKKIYSVEKTGFKKLGQSGLISLFEPPLGVPAPGIYKPMGEEMRVNFPNSPRQNFTFSATKKSPPMLLIQRSGQDLLIDTLGAIFLYHLIKIINNLNQYAIIIYTYFIRRIRL